MPHRKTLESLGWASLLEYLAARTHTSRGAERARALELLDDIEAARRRSAEIAEARLLRELDEPLPFGGVHDIAAHLARASKGGDLDGPELVAVAQTVNATGRLKRHLATHAATAPLLAGRAAPIALLAHVSGPILDSFEEGGRLSDNASAALGPMRRKVAALHEELSRRVKVLLDDPEISPYLQDRFYTQREDRYVVPLRAEARARVRGIVHGTSQSGHTVFVEPEVVVDLNNRLKLAESEVTEEEQRILAELSGYVREEAEAIGIAAAIAEELDLLDACARLADDTGASAAALGAPDLELRRARHPLMLLAGRTCVPNDIVLPAGKTLVISGPNAGGKTVALKTAGLAALMARAGLHLPVNDGSSVPWYLGVEVDIGDDQSLERNLSTFSAHVMNLVDFLERAGGETLLLVDELAVGTDPEQGSALAQAVLEAFADRGAQVIVTTHYERLKALPTADARFLNASVGFDLERMAPTFKLHLGVPGSSGAFLVARRLGLAGPVLARAELLLGDRRAGIEELLTAVTEERRRLDAERAAAETARREAEGARREAEARERAARAREEKARTGAHDDAVAAMRRARDELDQLRLRLKKADVPEVVTEAKARIAAIGADVAARAPQATPSGKPAAEADLVPGAAVRVASLGGGRGQVVAAPERGRVTVQVGPLRTTVSVEDLRLDDRPAPQPSRSAPPVKRRPAPPQAQVVLSEVKEDLPPARTSDATLDVRGSRVDDMLPEVDRFIDDSLLASREVVFFIHGHGTGALREAIREHLALHAGVARFRGGHEKEGGDGITIAWLDV